MRAFLRIPLLADCDDPEPLSVGQTLCGGPGFGYTSISVGAGQGSRS